MDIKQVIVDYIFNDEMKDKIVKELNDNVNIPIISEKTERAILEALWKIIKGILMKKLGV